MRLNTEIALGIGALLVVQVVTSVAAIGLLARMAPAVERILQENVVSLTAGEEMLAALARGAPGDDARFSAALERARANVTEPEETPLVATVAAEGPRALAGDPGARATTVEALTALAAVNRGSMERMDRRAQQLGAAGAWVAVALGTLGFALGTFVARRIARRIGGPLAELDATLQATAQGDRHRRCVVTEAPQELVRIAREVNDLLDRRLAVEARPAPTVAGLDRGALLALLDGAEGPVAVLDADGGLHAANAAALERLAGPDGRAIRDALRQVAGGELEERAAVVREARPFAGGWVCRLAP